MTPPTAAGRARIQLAGTFAVSSVAAVWSWTLGVGRLGTPSVRSLDLAAWRQWASNRTALDMSMSVIRVGVFVAATLVAVSVVVAVADGVRIARSVGRERAALALPLPGWLRRWRDLAFAVSLSAAVVAASTGAASAADRPSASALPRPTLAGAVRHAGDPASGQKWPDFDALEGLSPNSATVAAQPRPAARAAVPVSGPAVTTSAEPSTAKPPPDQSDTSPGGRIVRQGESLWSIAESVVIGSNPVADEHQVAEYWHRLIESNRASLRNPANADLLYPGDVVKLPVPG